MKKYFISFLFAFLFGVTGTIQCMAFTDIGEYYNPPIPNGVRGKVPAGYTSSTSQSLLNGGTAFYCWDHTKLQKFDWSEDRLTQYVHYNDAVFAGIAVRSISDSSGWDGNLVLEDKFYAYIYPGGQDVYVGNGDIGSYNFHITGIADYACYKMEDMRPSGTKTKLPEYLEWIGKYSFYDCKNIDIDFTTCKNSLKRIDVRAFKNCSNLSFAFFGLHDSLTYIAPEAFMNCSKLMQADLPPNLKKIEENCFSGDEGLLYVSMGNKIDSIAPEAFRWCTSLKTIQLSKSLKCISEFAFYNCGLKGELIIPDSVNQIQGFAFGAVKGLTGLTIGKGVEFIGGKAFSDSPFKSIIVNRPEPPIAFKETFDSAIFNTCTLFVPSGSKEKYSASEGWKEFNNIVEYVDDYIPVTTINGICKSYVIKEGIYNPLVLSVGTTHDLEAVVEPENATDKNIYWEIENEDIARISNNKIEMLKEGSTTLTIYHAQGIRYTIPLICGKPVNEVVIPSEMTVYIGFDEPFEPEILPSDASSPKVIISSEDPSIAQVGNPYIIGNRYIRGIAPGSTKVYAQTTDGSGVVGTCLVTVRKQPIKDITLNYTRWTNPYTEKGSKYKTLQLKASIFPDNAENNIVWSSNDQNIASVDSAGLVSFHGYGDVCITASSGDNPNICSKCNIKVDYKIDCKINGKSLSNDIYSNSIYNTEENKLTINLLPISLPIEEIKWDRTITSGYNDDEVLGEIDSDGNITILKGGYGYLHIYYSLYGKNHESWIPLNTVYCIQAIELDKDTLDIRVNDSIKLNASYTPKDALDYDYISWRSSDSKVATVDEYGTVYGINPGIATITASSSKFKGGRATCQVTVYPALIDVEQIGINLDQIKLSLLETIQLNAIIQPEDATNKTVEWSSDDTTVATVNENGLVTAVSPGTATITATTANGLTAECTVTVTAKVVLATSISIDKESIEGIEGTEIQLTATVLPDDVADKTVTWSSSDEDIATVDENGLVTIHGIGSATITATTNDGSNLSATCQIHGVSGIEAIIYQAGGADVFTASGVLLKLNADNEYLSTLGHGVYIIRAGGKTYKIVK